MAAACGVAERGLVVAADLEQRLAGAAPRPLHPRPSVAVIEWLDPLMLAGHWVPEAVLAAGGLPVGPRPGSPSPYASLEEIRALRPDAIVVAPCGFDLERTVAEVMPVAEVLRGLAPRVLLMDGNAYLNRPGPRVLDAIEALAVWLRGEAVADPLVRPLELAASAVQRLPATLQAVVRAVGRRASTRRNPSRPSAIRKSVDRGGRTKPLSQGGLRVADVFGGCSQHVSPEPKLKWIASTMRWS